MCGWRPSQSLKRRAGISGCCYMYTTLATGFLQHLDRLEILVRAECCVFHTNEPGFWTAIALVKAFKLRLVRHCGRQLYHITPSLPSPCRSSLRKKVGELQRRTTSQLCPSAAPLQVEVSPSAPICPHVTTVMRSCPDQARPYSFPMARIPIPVASALGRAHHSRCSLAR